MLVYFSFGGHWGFKIPKRCLWIVFSTTMKYNPYFRFWGHFWSDSIFAAFYLPSQGDHILYLHFGHRIKVKWESLINLVVTKVVWEDQACNHKNWGKDIVA